ncbi:hypothetical protein FVEN_g7792 [Fusarium venenatum]|uniref:Uncharacterized protein n=1 Tax=Fusarium venenatum TaxID=56646 RepID=A0A2L2TIT4_9HYPO|nr:uncharacterized protein FVRRES_08010 [Fusarium venenatum]KAG8354279.1 hypothetical protein FVEN_g7792 [Fusarium venenatum]KAH6964798.1 hypothetical protein EDB82DRAFT_285458 [Fusarium venenatum]CEI67933.1 unnamed protein product [Fusarium venenatum]
MFRYALFFLASILLTISYAIHEPKQHFLYPPPNGDIPQMLSEGGWYGDFGVTWFPRSEFGGSTGGIVHGWPAKGGFYSRLCSVAELEFLGLDRFEPSDKPDDPENEEAHCAKMRQLGANWFRDPDHKLRFGRKYRNKEPDAPLLFVGWPTSGGVWTLDTNFSQCARKGLARIDNAFTMEERCKVIEKLGGTFYADPKDCPHLDLDGSQEGENIKSY